MAFTKYCLATDPIISLPTKCLAKYSSIYDTHRLNNKHIQTVTNSEEIYTKHKLEMLVKLTSAPSSNNKSILIVRPCVSCQFDEDFWQVQREGKKPVSLRRPVQPQTMRCNDLFALNWRLSGSCGG